MSKNLEEKIYSMSNSFLPLNMFFNDIRDIDEKIYDKESAYKDLEKIADFIIDLQSQIDQLKQQLAETEQEFFVFQEDSIRNEQIYIRELAEKDKEIESLKQEIDDWKRACELACDVLRDINYKIYNEDRIDFENTFYQQAKKESKWKDD